jgi:hypothetical protein
MNKTHSFSRFLVVALALNAVAAATAPMVSGQETTHPPIDRPLRKQGIDPTHMRPFEDVEKYIAFLERADRDLWQKPDEVVTALGLLGDETVLDLGAGSGYFTFRLANALPRGKVIAADTEPVPGGPPESAKMSRAQTEELMTRAGLTLVFERADLLPYQTFLVFRKPR